MERILNNPYAAPAADLSRAIDDGQTYTPKMFALKGRIGRLRYLAYATCLGLIFGIAAVAIAMGMAAIAPKLVFLSLLAYIPAMAVGFIVAARRFNDMDQSGWLAALIIIPFANFFIMLWLIFGRGTPGSNRYGPAPTANTTWIMIGAWLPVIIGVALSVFIITNFGTYTRLMEKVVPGAAQTMPAPASETPQE